MNISRRMGVVSAMTGVSVYRLRRLKVVEGCSLQMKGWEIRYIEEEK